MRHLSIVYVTARKEPMINWFFKSLLKQLDKHTDIILDVVIVNYWQDKEPLEFSWRLGNMRLRAVSPLPSFCQGPHRITQEDYFDASIARNTGFVYAQYDYIAFVDDVSVLLPNWLEAVLEGMAHKQILLGTYQKVTKLQVEDGEVKHYEVQEHDKDQRLLHAPPFLAKFKCASSWFYGCSFAMPLEKALQVNGFDEMQAITGYEDCSMGLRLEKAGNQFFFDKRMATLESIEHHSNDVVMKRIDPEVDEVEYYDRLVGFDAQHLDKHPRWDASHMMLDIIKYSNNYESFWNGFDLRRLREKAQKGEEITVKDMGFPERWWFDGKLLREM